MYQSTSLMSLAREPLLRAPVLVLDGSCDITSFLDSEQRIIASKVIKPTPAEGLTKGLQAGLSVLLKAKDSQVDAVKKFLTVRSLVLLDFYRHSLY